MPARRPRLCWPLLALCLLCACCYRTALRGEFLHDDVWAILNNPDVRPGAPIRSIFGNDFWGKGMGENSSHKSYRPLCTLSFRLNIMLAGMDPFYFHAVNVFLHCVVTSMLMFTCDKAVFADRRPAFITALVFAVHPIHTEAVTGIVGRADVLACLLFLLTFLSYNRSVDHYYHGVNFPPTASPFFLLLSLLLGTSAMLVKETGITVFGVCLVYDLLVLCHRRLELQNGDVHPRITQHPGTFANSSGKENGKHRSTHKGSWNSCHSSSPGEQRGNSLPASCKAVSAILRYCSREGVINANIVT